MFGLIRQSWAREASSASLVFGQVFVLGLLFSVAFELPQLFQRVSGPSFFCLLFSRLSIRALASFA